MHLHRFQDWTPQSSQPASRRREPITATKINQQEGIAEWKQRFLFICSLPICRDYYVVAYMSCRSTCHVERVLQYCTRTSIRPGDDRHTTCTGSRQREHIFFESIKGRGSSRSTFRLPFTRRKISAPKGMISAVEWVPMGAADPNPKRYELSKAEMKMLEEQADMEADLEEEENANDDDDSSASPDTNKASETTGVKLVAVDISTLPADLRMNEYSEDEDDAQAEGRLGNILIGKETEMMGTNLDQNGMPVEDIDEEKGQRERERDDAKDSSDDDDDDIDNDANDSDDDLADVPDTREFIPIDVQGLEAMGLSAAGLGGAMNEEDDDDDASDLEDTNLRPDDAMVVVAKTDEDFASLEVHVYESKTGNLFVHHDIPLPSFPLCLAHGDINPDGGAGNYVAVGTFSPAIEIWNLDVLSALEPVAILGGEDTSGADELMRINMARAAAGKKLKKKKAGPQGSGLRPGSHKDAVMALSWNKVHRQVLASGSADKTVKVWDITQAGKPNACAATFVHHTDKVQSVAWHPSEGTILATGSFDRTVSLVDARSNDGKNYRKATLPADCEAIAWDPFQSQYLSAASEDGTVTCWDVRKFDQKLWSFVAHEYGGVSDLAYNA